MTAEHAQALIALAAAEVWRNGARNQEWGQWAAGPQVMLKDVAYSNSGRTWIGTDPNTGKIHVNSRVDRWTFPS